MAIETPGASATAQPGLKAGNGLGVKLGCALMAGAVLLFVWSLWAGHTRAVSSQEQGDMLDAMAKVVGTVTTAQSSQRGFVLAGTEAFLEPYREATGSIDADLVAFRRAAERAEVDPGRIEAIADLARQEMAFAERVVAARSAESQAAAAGLVVAGEGKRILDDLRSETRALHSAADGVIARNAAAEARLAWIESLIFAAAVAAALFLAVLSLRRQRLIKAGADLLADLMRAAPVGIAFLDRKGALVRSNDEFARVTARRPDETAPCEGEAPDAASWFAPILARAASEGRTVSERQFAFGDGASRTGIVSAFPTTGGGDGAHDGVGIFVLDTTDQMLTAAALDETSHQFLALADNIPQLAWTARPTGEIFWYNRRWYEYTGTTLEEMRGFGWSSVQHPDHAERVVKGYKAAIAAGTPWEDTFPLRAADGTFRWFLGQAIPIRGANGPVLRWFGTNTDVTKQRAIEEEFLAAKESAENANRAKSQFIANMSHELRTPLSAVIGYAELLEEEVEDLGQTHLLTDLKKIEGNARHLLSLINDVLDLSKIEAERMDVYAETFDLATVLDEVGSTVGSLISKKNNQLRIEHDGTLGAMHTDQVKLRQCLLNLLSNASKFTEDGTITMAAHRSSDGTKDWMTLEVSDSGIGMTAEQVAQLFERFAQADASTTRKFGGTGLGLAITRAFCRLLGGDIGVTSEAGKGTTFTIRIPAQVVPQAEEPDLPTCGNAYAVGPAGTVLAIDDDPHARELVTRFLSREGFAVRTASDGVSGMEMARALVPDIILLDVTMPKKDGWSVLSELKADPNLAAIPVVMITVLDEQRLGFALGASDYLLKPVEWEKLKEVMDRYRGSDGGLILAIDDDEDTLARYATMIERQGLEFASATNGRIGLERVRDKRPDLILLDLNMPVMDGFDFLKELRAHPEWTEIPVVVLSSKDLTVDERNALKTAADQVLSKAEVSMRQLADRIREALPPAS